MRLTVESTAPITRYDYTKNSLYIKENNFLYPETPFLENALQIINAHFEHSDQLHLYLYLNKMSATTVRSLFAIFKALKYKKDEGGTVRVTWFFDMAEGDSSEETAYDFSELFQLKFMITPI